MPERWTEPPAGRLDLASGDVHIWRIPLQCSPERASALGEILDPAERVRAGRLWNPDHGRRWTVGRAALRDILARYVTAAPAELCFQTGRHGKPALALPATGGPSFSLAHSGGLALLAVGAQGDIGIDVEALRALDDADAIAARFFSARETEALLAVNPGERVRAFLVCWTRKEAVLKATGTGLARPLNTVEVSLEPNAPARLRAAPGFPELDGEWTIVDVDPGAGYVGALALQQAPLRVHHFSWPGSAD